MSTWFGPALAWGLAVSLPLGFLAVFFLLPTATLVARGFLTETGNFDPSGLVDMLSRGRTWKIIWQTVSMAGIATIICLILGIPGAWVLYRTRFPGRGLVRAVVAVPFVLPSVVVGVAFRSLFATGGALAWLELDGTKTAIIIAMVFFNYSLAVRVIGGLWVRLDPRTEQAAATLGAGAVRRLFTVTLPRLLPALTSAAAMIFLFCTTAFALVLILGGTRTATVETEIYFLTTGLLDLRSASVLSIIQLVVITTSLWLGSLARKTGANSDRLRTDLPPRPLGRADLPALLVTATVIALLIVAPILSLLWRSLHRQGHFTFSNYTDLLVARAVRVLNDAVITTLGRSLQIALVATLVAISVGTLVSIVVSRRPRSHAGRRALAGLDAIFMLPLGVSAVTVGFGFLIALDKPPVDLRGSWWLIPLAQAVVAIPLVMRVVTPILGSIDPRQREVAAALGASSARVLATIDGPYIARSLAVATAFAFAMSLGEFGATSFLARPNSMTLPVAIYHLQGFPSAQSQGMALAGCVVLATLSATVMALVEWLGDRESVAPTAAPMK